MNFLQIIEEILAQTGKRSDGGGWDTGPGRKRRRISSQLKAMASRSSATTGDKPPRNYRIRRAGWMKDDEATAKRRDGAVVIKPTTYSTPGRY